MSITILITIHAVINAVIVVIVIVVIVVIVVIADVATVVAFWIDEIAEIVGAVTVRRKERRRGRKVNRSPVADLNWSQHNGGLARCCRLGN